MYSGDQLGGLGTPAEMLGVTWNFYSGNQLWGLGFRAQRAPWNFSFEHSLILEHFQIYLLEFSRLLAMLTSTEMLKAKIIAYFKI